MIYSNFLNTSIDNFFNDVHDSYRAEATNLELSLPGFSKKDINIEVEGRTLTISSEVEKEKQTFYVKPFKKSYILPSSVDGNALTAKMENGLLTIDFGNKSEKKSVTIK